MTEFTLSITEKTMKHLIDLKKSYEEDGGCKYTESEALQELLISHVKLIEMFGEVLVVIADYIETNESELIDNGMSKEDVLFLRECVDLFLKKVET